MNMRSPASSSNRVIPSRRVIVGPTPVQLTAPRQTPQDAPEIHIEWEGDVVRSIEVTCSCGERIRIACDYTPPGLGTPASTTFQRSTFPDQSDGKPQS